MNMLTNGFKKLPGFFASVLWCFSLSWNSSKFYTIVRIGNEVLRPVLTITASFIGKNIINLLAGASGVNKANETLLFLLIGLLVIALLRSVSQKLSGYCQAMHSELLNDRISIMMMERSLSVDLEYFDNPEYHDKLISANRDAQAISFILWNVLSCVSAVISFIGTFFVLCQANFTYGLIMVAVAFPSSVAAAKYTKLLYKLSLEQVNEERKMNYYKSVAIDKRYAQDIRLYNAGEMLKKRYRHIWAELFAKRKNMTKRRASLTGLLECLPEIVVSLVGIDVAFKVVNGHTTVGDYSLYTGLIGQLWSAVYMLSSSSMQIYDNQMKIENLKALEKFNNNVIDDGRELLERVDTIEFEHVCFQYPKSKESALDDLSFRLHKGEKLALVGLNGSGKSTFIKLLLRMYDPDKGTIRINDLDIKKYKLSSLRANFSVYFQEMSNYCFTLRDNFTIADGRREGVDESIMDSLQASYCHDILSKTQNRFDINITKLFNPDGIELSGGQHQKLALARALYRRHSALILDEPSSNLDPKAEHEIFKALQVLTEGKMTIFISHRLSNIFLADRIIVLEKGRIIEDGTQDELLKNKQRYAELFRYQQEKFLQHN